VLYEYRSKTRKRGIADGTRRSLPTLTNLPVRSVALIQGPAGFGRLFKQATGRSSSLVDAAARRSRRWFQGKAAARTAFV
jgi:hypothetical protein